MVGRREQAEAEGTRAMHSAWGEWRKVCMQGPVVVVLVTLPRLPLQSYPRCIGGKV